MWTGGGLVAFLIPVTSIRATTSWLVYLWALFLLVGGLLSAYGAVTDRWIGELVGLPLISSAFGVWFVVLALAFTVNGAAGSLAFGGVALHLWARWQDVSTVRREAERAAHPGPREAT